MHSPPNAHVHIPRHQAYEAHSNGTYITAKRISDFYILPQVWTFQWHLYHQYRLLRREMERENEWKSKSAQSHQVQLSQLYLKCPLISTTAPALRWNDGATRQRAHHQQSATPLVASEGTLWERAFLFVCNHIAFGRWRPWHILYIFPPRFFSNVKKQKQSCESSPPTTKENRQKTTSTFTPPHHSTPCDLSSPPPPPLR